MSSNKINSTNLKSVSGGKSEANVTNVNKAKAIVKEELMKESLSKSSGKGPYPTSGNSDSANKAADKGAKSLDKSALSKATGTGPYPTSGNSDSANKAADKGTKSLDKAALSKATGTGPYTAINKQGARTEGRPGGQLSVKGGSASLPGNPPVCLPGGELLS